MPRSLPRRVESALLDQSSVPASKCGGAAGPRPPKDKRSSTAILERSGAMNIFYIIGVIVVVLAILGFLGLR